MGLLRSSKKAQHRLATGILSIQLLLENTLQEDIGCIVDASKHLIDGQLES